MAGQGQELAPLVKEIRKKMIDRDMSQKELAAIVGMPSGYLNKILTGYRKGRKYLPRICSELGLCQMSLAAQHKEKPCPRDLAARCGEEESWLWKHM